MSRIILVIAVVLFVVWSASHVFVTAEKIQTNVQTRLDAIDK